MGGDDGCLQFKQGVERGEGIWMDPLNDIPAQISAKGKCTRFNHHGETRSIEMRRLTCTCDYVQWLPKEVSIGSCCMNVYYDIDG